MSPNQTRTGALAICPLETGEDARACDRLMAASEPWITLGRSYEVSLDIIEDRSREVYNFGVSAARPGMAHHPI